MAHSASVGSAKRTVDVAGKRLGVKKFGGEFVKAGEIIIRQKGSLFYPGTNTDIGRDFTIFSKVEGFVNFRRMTGHKRGQKYVDVLLKQAPITENSRPVEKANPTVKLKQKKEGAGDTVKAPKTKIKAEKIAKPLKTSVKKKTADKK